MNATIKVIRATRWVIAFTDLVAADAWGEMWFGVKRIWDQNKGDGASVILVSLNDGLVVQWRTETPDAAHAEITVEAGGQSVTVTIDAPATDFWIPEQMVYELIGSEGSGIAAQLASGAFFIQNAVVRSAAS